MGRPRAKREPPGHLTVLKSVKRFLFWQFFPRKSFITNLISSTYRRLACKSFKILKMRRDRDYRVACCAPQLYRGKPFPWRIPQYTDAAVDKREKAPRRRSARHARDRLSCVGNCTTTGTRIFISASNQGFLGRLFQGRTGCSVFNEADSSLT